MSQRAAYPFVVGHTYTRNDVFEVIGLSPKPTGGDWFTGYTSHHGDKFIFAGVGTPGRTGHDYRNRWVGESLEWEAKGGTRLSMPSIREFLAPDARVYVFWREGDRAAFTFAGIGQAKEVRDTTPVQIVWSFPSTDEGSFYFPDDIAEPTLYFEGAKTQVWVNKFERDRAGRQACVSFHGHACVVCGFDFFKRYGEIGRDFIHVHHLIPVSAVGEQYALNPISDLRPVCPNCHAMLHRREPPYTPEELREWLITPNDKSPVMPGAHPVD